jgi:hypothetical protein
VAVVTCESVVRARAAGASSGTPLSRAAATLRVQSFAVFDALSLAGKPDLRRFGIRRLQLVYEREVWGGHVERSEPATSDLRRLARSLSGDVPVVLDVERWPVQVAGAIDASTVEANIDRLIRIVETIRAEAPALQIGFYGLLPIREYRIQYGAAIDPSRYAAADSHWREGNARLERLASHVDFVCPSLYTAHDLPGTGTYREYWKPVAVSAIREARRYGKPVYPFLWPQFTDVDEDGRKVASRTDRRANHAYIPTGFWRQQLQLMLTAADGAIVWSSDNAQLEGWNGSRAWWKVLHEFAAGLPRSVHSESE